jgi:hypothetical protein
VITGLTPEGTQERLVEIHRLIEAGYSAAQIGSRFGAPASPAQGWIRWARELLENPADSASIYRE